jgi:hypothetical protein
MYNRTIELIEQDKCSLKYVSPEFQDDKDIVLICVKKDGMELKYASFRLQDDREVALNRKLIIRVSATYGM